MCGDEQPHSAHTCDVRLLVYSKMVAAAYAGRNPSFAPAALDMYDVE